MIQINEIIYKQLEYIKLPVKTTKNYEIFYVGMTKRKIEERLKEDILDLKNYNQTTALARTNIETPIQINTVSIEKLLTTAHIQNIRIITFFSQTGNIVW